jgi:hypothetical protein
MPYINRRWLTGSLVAAGLATACGGSGAPSPPQSPTPSPTDVIQITGREQLAWAQTAANIGDLHFAVYVDGNTRVELSAATCAPAASDTSDCQSPLPPLSNGKHTLELVAWVDAAGAALDSARTPPLTVQVTNGAADMIAGSVTAGAALTPSGSETPSLPSGCGVVPASDRDLIVWDSTGRIRVVDAQSSRMRTLSWTTPDDERWILGGLAVHPRFAENGWIYLAQTGRGDEPLLRVVRYRKQGDVLGERAVLFQYAPATQPARVRLTLDQNDRLYIALLAGDAGTGALKSAAPHQFLIRLTADGQVPVENPGGSVFADVVASRPIDIAWLDEDSVPWVIEQTRTNGYSLVPGRSGDPRSGPSFSAASAPIAAQVLVEDERRTLWVVFGDGEALRLQSSAAGWAVSSQEPLLAAPRAVRDAALLAGQEMAICGPALESDRAAGSAYGVWRVRLRN